MAQSPFLTDQVQFEPGASGTRLINMGSGGELQFEDPDVSGVFLRSLVGTRSITGVFTVGRAGDGAAYTSIQDALDAVPTSSSTSAPSVLLIYPGDYTENLVIQKDGVALYGFGDVRIINNGHSDTIEISASLDVTPQKITFSGLKIECTDPAGSCVRLIGADTFATGSITVETTVSTPPLAAGDTITIDGNPLVGIEGTRNSGSNNFNVLGSTTGAVAAEITAALNDTSNSFAATIRASIVGAVVTIDAIEAGAAGNLIALTDATATVGALTLSGATLTGGGAAGSLVASERLLLDGCEVVASGAAAYQVRANTCGVIEVRGGTWAGSDNASLASISNCSRFRMFNVEWANDIEMAYDTALDRPSDTTSAYSVGSVGRLHDVASNFAGDGSLTVKSCPIDGSLEQAGDQALTVLSSSVGSLTLSDTTAAILTASGRGTATVTAGSPTLADSLILDSVAFVAPAVSAAYSFDVTQPNTSYTVALESPTTGSVLAVTNKTTLGFDVEASVTFSGTVGLSIARSQ